MAGTAAHRSAAGGCGWRGRADRFCSCAEAGRSLRVAMGSSLGARACCWRKESKAEGVSRLQSAESSSGGPLVVGRPLVGTLLASNGAGASSVVAGVGGCSSGMNDGHDGAQQVTRKRMNRCGFFFFLFPEKRAGWDYASTGHLAYLV